MSKKDLASADYVHLHNHTHYSLLDGLQKVPDMVERVAELGMEAVAMTDHGTLSGTIEFYKVCKEKGVKPIIGIETYIASRKHTNKDPQKDKGRFHLILIAMNETGYKNLMKLSTIANLDGFYYKPRIDHDLLEQYSEGLICLSGCVASELGEAIRAGDIESAKKTAAWYKKLFGDRYYIELQDHAHKWEEQKKVNDVLMTIADEQKIEMVVTCDAHYLKHEDQEAHEVLLCVQTGSFLDDPNRMSLTNTDLYVTDPKDIIERWGNVLPKAVSNTKVIADRCEIELELGKILIPKFPVPKGETEKSYLHTLVYQGLAWRYGKVSLDKSKKLTIDEAKKSLASDILNRAEFELNTIESMGFNGYFLIIWDFVTWGKEQGITFGPGRGSAAGSIVSYALRITEIDPLPYDLLFERFLNPDRISMPDIDIDIQDTRRDEVIQYVVEKYGKDRVANIVTFGKMAARNAVRDVARVLKVPYADADRLAKMIPPPVQGRHIPLKDSLENVPELKAEYTNNPVSRRVFDLAKRVEGTIRSHGVHAAGVVIAPETISAYVPLEMAQKGVVATQYPMGPIEELGLLKMDFLGLSNLTIIKNTLRIIKKVTGDVVDIDSIPLDDKMTYELLSRGDTTGVFQLESAGMKRYLKDLKPSVFEDIVAMVALYRPGPMQWIDDFIARKHGKKAIEYQHDAMEPALRSTYGVIVYQEQVMQISKEMCGFTGGQADTLRKAIGKKNVDVMKKMKEDFINGAITTVGANRELMDIFWKQLEDFAAYCFNKSHAACYAYIAYQTAYLKAHYPEAFMAALMTSDFDNTDRLAIEIAECRYMGIEVLPPDVNESYHEFSVVPGKNQIRFGLDAIKNVGHGAVSEILRAREESGPFRDISDFVSRVSTRIVNKKAWESLTKAGAFDRFADRNGLLGLLESILSLASKFSKELNTSQANLFTDDDVIAPRLDIVVPQPSGEHFPEYLQWERELLGLYLSSHPLSGFDAYLREQSVPISELKPEHDSRTAQIGGIISLVRQIPTKKGQNMAFVKVEDSSGEIEVIVFPAVYATFQSLWVQDKVVLINGKISSRDKLGNLQSEVKLMADDVVELTMTTVNNYEPTGERRAKIGDVVVAKTYTKRTGIESPTKPKFKPQPKLYIRFADSSDAAVMTNVKKALDTNPGATEVILVIGHQNPQAIRLPNKVTIDEVLIRAISDIIGTDNVKLQ